MLYPLSDPLLSTLFAALLGLFVGSFLNVVIYRLPKMMENEWQAQAAELRGEALGEQPQFNLAMPRSRCPHCGHLITAIENIPVVSYMVLRGRCRHCRAPISLRYPSIELVSAMLSAAAIWHFGLGVAGIGALLFVWIMVALAFIDLDTQLLPDSLTLALLWGGLTFNLMETYTTLPDAVIGAMAGYLSLWSVFWLFKLLTGKEGMGYGDFKLLAAIGAWVGWKMLPLVILFSSLTGAVMGVCLILFARHGRNIPIPFGPYLAVAGLIALFCGDAVVDSYLSLLK